MSAGTDVINWSPLRPATDWKNIPPADKLAVVEAMGFTPVWEEHQPDCPHAALFDDDDPDDVLGLICVCVPPGTSFHPPRDVRVELGETREQLLAHKKDR